ncbi:MAG: hypothetical protein H6R15_1988 [Proteobacteria bacterium]|nr:hypothetical protein [Pseudomonadota bacterium]
MVIRLFSGRFLQQAHGFTIVEMLDSTLHNGKAHAANSRFEVGTPSVQEVAGPDIVTFEQCQQFLEQHVLFHGLFSGSRHGLMGRFLQHNLQGFDQFGQTFGQRRQGGCCRR